ncbi:MAG TPA: hypothetical protein VFP46_02765 [Candidatus Paceibacterota bacterium]|nr:hypothetical protein [Candidatus Paceibacterota bacterium]
MSHEGINGRPEQDRGPSAAAMGHSQEREFTLDAKGEEYKALQMQLAEMEQKLEQGNKSIENEPLNSPKRQLATAIGREISRELDALRSRKDGLENDIRNAGGDPSHYTVQ